MDVVVRKRFAEVGIKPSGAADIVSAAELVDIVSAAAMVDIVSVAAAVGIGSVAAAVDILSVAAAVDIVSLAAAVGIGSVAAAVGIGSAASVDTASSTTGDRCVGHHRRTQLRQCTKCAHVENGPRKYVEQHINTVLAIALNNKQ
ncbi:unnamed protein product [Macrosiphum euphorbiae]|uniref:Uncharacterized protein n=1 Tax=Macrosiphum euphorbiae TaxID=13131 RepID=A0AAV0XJ38_9HEMI|nr:unnamed protein product [Macrosiphum euphorbiae]